MSKNFINSGTVLDLVAPSGGVVSGKGYLIGGLFVIALVSAAEGETFAGQRNGNWELDAATHATTQAFSPGDPVYWNDSTKLATKTATGNLLIGAATAAKVSTASSVQVNLWSRAAAPVAAITKPATTAATTSTPYGYSQAQANAIPAAIGAIIDALALHGIAVPG